MEKQFLRNLGLIVAVYTLGFYMQEACGKTIDEIIASSTKEAASFDFIGDINGTVLRVELDMMLSLEQYNALYDRQTVQDNAPDTTRYRRYKRKATRSLSTRWINNEIPYSIDKYAFTRKEKIEISNAIKEWEDNTCINFRAKQPSDFAYIHFEDGTGCSSYIGMGKGKREISLADGCRESGVIAHEIGHAVGFYHEQNRPDRDAYVIIKKENLIHPELYSNFQKYSYSQIATYGVPYDYTSVMHYGGTAFSGNGKNTILTINPAFQNEIGNRNGLSFLDIKLANLMYNCGNNCKSTLKCPMEGFMSKNCTCLCPGGPGNPVKKCEGTSVITERPLVRTTTRPTVRPTIRPTPRPTIRPTPRPTIRPTPRPTIRPTPRPTIRPTPRPTIRPTPRPTIRPTPRPTIRPTPRPTIRPTPRPTIRPTPRPTIRPTRRPTMKSTPRPTIKSTPRPTLSPTACTDISFRCPAWAKTGYCQTSNYVKTYCKASCSTCKVAASTTASPCVDVRPHCSYWGRMGFCSGTYQAFMASKCPMTCGLCKKRAIANDVGMNRYFTGSSSTGSSSADIFSTSSYPTGSSSTDGSSTDSSYTGSSFPGSYSTGSSFTGSFSRGIYSITDMCQVIQDVMEYRKGLSFHEMKIVNLMYNCRKNCRSELKCPMEGFMSKDCTCICPGNPVNNCDEANGITKRPLVQTSTRPTKRPTSQPTIGATSRPILIPTVCTDVSVRCPAWARLGQCQTNNYVKTYCKASCSTCKVVLSTTASPCVDGNSHCSYWGGHGFCSGTYQTFMAFTCPVTCGLCKEKEVDKDVEIGRYSTGSYSTGSYSTGSYPTGSSSTGSYPTGSSSTGSYPTGSSSTGSSSTGTTSPHGSFSRGNYSITDKCYNFGSGIGNRNGLSFNDIKLVNLMYNCSKNCRSGLKCPIEGFMSKDCTCLCPGSPVRICDGTNGITERPLVRTSIMSTARPTIKSTFRPTIKSTSRPTIKSTSKSTMSPTIHTDISDRCPLWAKSGYCQTRNYVKNYCKASCSTHKVVLTTTASTCIDVRPQCSYWGRQGLCSGRMKTFMASRCPATCGLCKEREIGKDGGMDGFFHS